MNSSSHKQPLTHFKSEGPLDPSPRQESSDQSLDMNDSPQRDLVEIPPIVPRLSFIITCSISKVGFFILLGLVRATSSHVSILSAKWK